MSKNNVDMFVIKDYTIVRVTEGSSLAVTTLSEKETVEIFGLVLKDYGYEIVKK